MRARGKQMCEDVKHKIEACKLNQEKIKGQSKYLLLKTA